MLFGEKNNTLFDNCLNKRAKLGQKIDLFIVLGVGSAAIAVELSVQLPYVSVAAVAAADPPQELLHFGPHRSCLLAMAVGKVFNYSSHKNLENLSGEQGIIQKKPADIRSFKHPYTLDQGWAIN